MISIAAGARPPLSKIKWIISAYFPEPRGRRGTARTPGASRRGARDAMANLFDANLFDARFHQRRAPISKFGATMARRLPATAPLGTGYFVDFLYFSPAPVSLPPPLGLA